MAVSKVEQLDVLYADSDLSAVANLYRIVKATGHRRPDATGPTGDLCGAGDEPYGIIYQTAAQGEPLSVATLGMAKIQFGGTVAAGAFVKPDAEGRAITAATGDATIGQVRLGGAADEIGEVQIVKKTAA